MLKPCPFCESGSLFVCPLPSSGRNYVVCTNCAATGPVPALHDIRPSDQAAIEEWNIWAEARRMVGRE